MKAHFRTLTADKITRYSMATSIMLLVVSVGFIAISYSHLPPILPLFNQLPWGVARLGNKLSIFLPFTIALIFSLMNVLFASITYQSMPLIARVMSVTSFLISLLCLIFTVRTILLIT